MYRMVILAAKIYLASLAKNPTIFFADQFVIPAKQVVDLRELESRA